MNFEEFKQQIMEDLPGALPERLSNVEIEPVSVTKLQHGSYDGITIREEGSNIGMNLDLTRLYDRMETGTAYDDVLAEAVAVISNATAQAPNIDVDRLMDYDQLKETLSIQVVPTASNAEMLENIPHKEMEDLSMVYRFVVGQDESGMQTILVTNKLLEQYGISEDQLHADAMENAPVFKPVQIRSMTEVLAEMMGQDFAEDMGLPTPDELIQLIIAHNNLANFETWIFFKWIFKTAVAVYLITNCFNITMAVFDVAQHVISNAGGLIAGGTAIDDSALASMRSSLELMDLGPLIGVYFQSLIVQLTIRALGVVIFVIVYGRMIEIYLNL